MILIGTPAKTGVKKEAEDDTDVTMEDAGAAKSEAPTEAPTAETEAGGELSGAEGPLVPAATHFEGY